MMEADWPDLPTGLVQLARVDDLLRDYAEKWQLDAAPGGRWRANEPAGGFSVEWRLLSPRVGLLGDALTIGTPRAIGQLADGRLAWIPAAVWKRDGAGDSPSVLWDVTAAGRSIGLNDQHGAAADVLPLIEVRALASVFNAAKLPDAARAGIMAKVLDVEAGDSLAPPAAVVVVEPAPPGEAPSASTRRGAGGRKTTHDWDAFWIEAFLHGDKAGFEGEEWAAFSKHMQEWSAGMGSKDQPDVSTVRRKLALLKAAMNQRAG